jgi:Tol biopolymer transport system component
MITRSAKKPRLETSDDFFLKPPPELSAREEETRCAKTWEDGNSYDPDDVYPIVMKPSSNCSVPIGDKIAYIQLPEDEKWLNLYLQSVERLRPVQILERNGVFTWLLYRKDGNNLQFAATPVRSMYELGTIHRTIAKAVGAKTIHGAGEMKKTGKKIVFNFLSGSYMMNWIRTKDKSCTLPEMEDYVEPKLRAFFPGIEMVKTDKTFINNTDTPATMEELQLYADAHFIVCVHDKTEVDTCRKVKGTCENPLQSRGN